MNDFYAMGNWATMSSEFIDGRGGDEGIRGGWREESLEV